MPEKHTAQCACRQIKVEFDSAPTFVAICRCRDSKRASDGEAAVFFGMQALR